MTKQIKILGSGCKNCNELHKLIVTKAQELQADVVIIKSEDMMDIISAGVMTTPAVLIDGTVVHSGGMPTKDQIEEWLQ